MITTLQGTGIELTEAIKSYVEEKVAALEKFMPHATKVEVDVGMRTHHHHKGKIFYAEINVHQPTGNLRVEKDAEDLYKAIDKVKDHLKVELAELKNKKSDLKRRTRVSDEVVEI